MLMETEYLSWDYRANEEFSKFCRAAFKKLHPGNEAEVPEDIFWSHATRLRIQKILGAWLGVQEVLDMTCFANPEADIPDSFIILHGFLRTWQDVLKESSFLSVPKIWDETGSFSGPVWIGYFRRPEKIIQRTLRCLDTFLAGDGRIPFVHPNMIPKWDFSVREE